jgi:heme a synthase
MDFKSIRPVVWWLYIGVALTIIQVALGGITRLTGSGLSITEWKPIVGALYPSSEAEWQLAFEKYKSIAQYKYLNADYQLSDFKFIFFWEWLHRNWARVIAVVFFLPFVFFIIKGYLKKEWIPQMILLFVVGMLQGLVGWLMVASGLNDTNLYVDHLKLAAHFITAMVALVYTFWLSMYIQGDSNLKVSSAARGILVSVTILLVVQLFYGAFMAGLKAAQAAPTWPLIGDSFFPNTLGSKSWISNPINVHFVHRNLAYFICVLLLTWAFLNRKINKSIWLWPIMALFAQIGLGIASVLYAPYAIRNNMGVFEWSAQLHQLVALVLLLSIVRALFVTRSTIYAPKA